MIIRKNEERDMIKKEKKQVHNKGKHYSEVSKFEKPSQATNANQFNSFNSKLRRSPMHNKSRKQPQLSTTLCLHHCRR